MKYPTVWSDGKRRGSIKDRKTSYLARIDVEGITKSKGFPFTAGTILNDTI